MNETDIIRLIIGVLVIGGSFWICLPSLPATPVRKEPEVSDCPQPVMAYKDDRGHLHSTLADAQTANRRFKRESAVSLMKAYVYRTEPPWLRYLGEDVVVAFLEQHRRRVEEFYRELDEAK